VWHMAFNMRHRLEGGLELILFKEEVPPPLKPQGCSLASNIDDGSFSSASFSTSSSMLATLIHTQFAVTEDKHRSIGGVGGSILFSLAGDGIASTANDLTRKVNLEGVYESLILQDDIEVEELSRFQRLKETNTLKWGCWLQPVLSWDLSTFALILLTSPTPPCLNKHDSSLYSYVKSMKQSDHHKTHHVSSGGGGGGSGGSDCEKMSLNDFIKFDRMKLMKVLTLVRLCQILLEPDMRLATPTSSASADMSDNDDTTTPLALLRDKLCRVTACEVDVMALGGYALGEAVKEKLAPFMVYLLTLDKLITGVTINSSTSGGETTTAKRMSDKLWEVLSLDRDDMESLLLLFGLPSSIDAICSSQEVHNKTKK
jgi:hypothetical protein